MVTGSTAHYLGSEVPFLTKVKIVGVVKRYQYPFVIDEESLLERLGGVDKEDRVIVVPWIHKEQRWSFVTSDPRAVDIDVFQHLL